MFTIRPVVTEQDVGAAGWRILLQDARRYGRRPNHQALALIRYALHQRLSGRNVELTPLQVDRLLEQQPEQLETVA